MTVTSSVCFVPLTTEAEMSEQPLGLRWARTIAAIQKIEIGLDDRGARLIFTVIPERFEAQLMNRLETYFILKHHRGMRGGSVIPGKLFAELRESTINVMRTFRFTPRRPEDLKRIHCVGERCWLNVLGVTLITPLGRRILPNLSSHAICPS